MSTIGEVNSEVTIHKFLKNINGFLNSLEGLSAYGKAITSVSTKGIVYIELLRQQRSPSAWIVVSQPEQS
jgi:hypothetical protein